MNENQSAILRARGTVYSVGRVVDVGAARLALMWHWPMQALELHSHANTCVHFFLKGAYFESLDSQIVIAGQGSLLVKSTDEPHANLMGAMPSLALRIEFRDDSLPTLAPKFAAVPRRSEVEAMKHIARLMWQGAPGEDLEIATIRAINTIHYEDREQPTTPEDRAATTLCGCEDHVRIDALARDVGLHRSHLARRFQEKFGCGMREFALRQQATRVLQAATYQEMSLGESMTNAGFYDQSHGVRVLRKLLGRSPSAWLAAQQRIVKA